MSSARDLHVDPRQSLFTGHAFARPIATLPPAPMSSDFGCVLSRSSLGSPPLSADDLRLSHDLTKALRHDDPRVVLEVRERFEARIQERPTHTQALLASAVLSLIVHSSDDPPCTRRVWQDILHETHCFWRDPSAPQVDTELAAQTVRMCEQLHAALNPRAGSYVHSLPDASGMAHLQSAIVLAWSQPLRGDWRSVQCEAFELSRSTEHIVPSTFLTDNLWVGIELLEQVAPTCSAKAAVHLRKVTMSLADRVVWSLVRGSTQPRPSVTALEHPAPGSLTFRASKAELDRADQVFERARRADGTTVETKDALSAIRVCLSQTADLPPGQDSMRIQAQLFSLIFALDPLADHSSRSSMWHRREVSLMGGAAASGGQNMSGGLTWEPARKR